MPNRRCARLRRDGRIARACRCWPASPRSFLRYGRICDAGEITRPRVGNVNRSMPDENDHKGCRQLLKAWGFGANERRAVLGMVCMRGGKNNSFRASRQVSWGRVGKNSNTLAQSDPTFADATIWLQHVAAAVFWCRCSTPDAA